MTRADYRVLVSKKGRWWAIEIPELQLHTQARDLGEVEHMARDAVALALDAPYESIQLHLDDS